MGRERVHLCTLMDSRGWAGFLVSFTVFVPIIWIVFLPLFLSVTLIFLVIGIDDHFLALPCPFSSLLAFRPTAIFLIFYFWIGRSLAMTT